jgi:hypothetical protein
MAMEIVGLISGYFQYVLLHNAAGGIQISTEAAVANDTREQIIAIVYLIAYIISAVTFIRWFRRAYYNLHTKIDYLNYSENWASSSWIVPVVNLYRPYQIMKELYQETRELLTNNGITRSFNLSTNLLIWWWTIWVINNILGQIIYRFSMNADTVDKLIFSTTANMLSNIIGIPLALITIKIIKDYSASESLLYETFGRSKEMQPITPTVPNLNVR